MKKLTLIFVILITLFLSSCDFEINVENEVYDVNAYQVYQNYLERDIVTADQFITVMNDFTYEVIPNVIEVKTNVRDALTFDILTSYQSTGIIIEQTTHRVLVLTPLVFVNTDENTFTDYNLYDYKQDFKSGTLIYYAQEYGLALIQFTKLSDESYPELSVARYHSTQGEPVVILGQQYLIKNAMTMGFIAEIKAESKQLDIESDIETYGLGNTLFNLRGELIGIYTYTEGQSDAPRFFDFKHIKGFLDLYDESLETSIE